MLSSGKDLRNQDHRDSVIICKQEEKINDIFIDITEINGSLKALNLRINGVLDKIATHMVEGESYRRLIVGTAVSLVIAILGGIGTAGTIAYNLGQYTQQILTNSERLRKLENNGPESVKRMDTFLNELENYIGQNRNGTSYGSRAKP
jgi:hypothetical protein